LSCISLAIVVVNGICIYYLQLAHINLFVMKSSTSRNFLIIVILPALILFGFTSLTSGVEEENNILKVGVSKVNITPNVPVPMSGYGARTEVFQGVHDSLYAYAVIFDDGTTQAVLITADLIGFSDQFCKETSQLIENKTGIPAGNIMLSATHNHGGPQNNTYGSSDNTEIIDYVVFTQGQIIKAVELAVSNKMAARIGSGKGKCNMNINRRAMFADGNVWLGRNPDGPCDKEVSVVRIDNASGQPLAILTNWATHGTTGGQENYQITGDWPGAASKFIVDLMGGNIVAPVTAGASGDINPIYGPNDRFRDIDAIGIMLAKEVARVAGAIETHAAVKVSSAQVTLPANGRKPTDNYRPNQALEPADPVNLTFSVLKVGGIVFAGISGEVMTEIGMEIKQSSPYRHTVVITHCNGSAGYLVTDDAFQEGGYEAMVSRTMPGTSDLIIENIDKMIRELP
jgi:hypothetical protein